MRVAASRLQANHSTLRLPTRYPHAVLHKGIHLVHKPAGPSSFSRLQEFLREHPPAAGTKAPKTCHGGVLDPFASGLLLILVGPATRLFDLLHELPKTYHATIRWGVETDNSDPTGRVTRQGDASHLTPEALERALQPMLGWRDQQPPATSNKRIAGKRAYELAHQGEAVSLPASRVYLHAARWTKHDLPNSSELELVVRGGYYIRALARELGELLGCGAHVAKLHRSAIGPWVDPGLAEAPAITGAEVLPWAASRVLSDSEVGRLKQGSDIEAGLLDPPRWLLPEGFPTPTPLVLGVHLGRLQWLLLREGDRLQPKASLRGL